MAWWDKVVFPVRRAWVAVAARVKARKEGGGILSLRDDVQTCGYSDVEVMWEMLRRSDTKPAHAPKRKRPILRVPAVSARAWSCGGPIVPQHQ